MLYVFEDNETVIKMIIKGRSPTMRRVSRTHRVALDWLFDTKNLDPQIQIRHMDTAHQLADILTKGNFTRDEWNNLLHLFNISHLSSTCCTKNFCLIRCSTMAKRIQNQKEEERVVFKSRPEVMNMSSFLPTSSFAASSPIAPKSPGVPIATGKLESRMRGNSKSDAASSSQAQRELLDTATGKLVATKKEAGDVDLSESETGSEEDDTGKPVANETAAGKPYAPSQSACQGRPKAEKTEWSHNLRPFVSWTQHSRSSGRIYGREHDDPLNDLNVKMAMCGIFLNATLRAAVHLGQDCEANLRFGKNNLWNSTGQFFREPRKLISEQKKNTGVSTIRFKDASWMSTSFL